MKRALRAAGEGEKWKLETDKRARRPPRTVAGVAANGRTTTGILVLFQAETYR